MDWILLHQVAGEGAYLAGKGEVMAMTGHGWKPLAAMGLAACALAAPALAQGTFAYRKQIQVNGGASGLAGGPHLNFPLLVSLPNDADLLAHVAAGGRDIMFEAQNSTMCGGPASCILPHEIERWDGATGTLVAWVRVPSILAGDKVYMYYGNAQIAAPTQTPASVWNTGYVGVWHLGETGSGATREYRDSSAFTNHGRGGKGVAAAVPARVNGKIGFAQSFSNGDGTYDFVDVGSDGSLNVSGTAITLEAWVRHNIVVNTAHGTPPTTSAPYGILAHKGWDNGYSLWLMGDDFQCPGSDTRPCAIVNVPGRSYSARTTMTAGPTPGTWHHVVGTYDGANVRLYLDGALQASVPKTGNVAPSAAEAEVYIGHGDQPENVGWSGQFEGDIDEVRISQVARSANWILTEYNNQSAPASFYTVGSEETSGGPWALTPITVNYRSIGAALDYSTGTVSATLGSPIVDGVGTLWQTNNRGRGDRITIDAVDYTILAVESETRLRLTSPFTSATNSYAYAIARKFGTPQAWENCISGGACPGVSSASLVADNRSEIGIYYPDGPNPAGSPVITFDGSITDAAHTITLTVDPGHRHPGRGAVAPTWAAFANNGVNALVQIYDDYVTVEWLELKHTGAASTSAHSIEINNVPAANHSVIRYNVIHGTGNGIHISDPDTVADIYNNVIYETNYGIRLNTDLAAAARLNIFNNTIYSNNAATGPAGIKPSVTQSLQRIDLRNNIVHSNTAGDIGVAPPFDRAWFFNGVYTDIRTQVADSTVNVTLNFTNVGTDCLYVGSQSLFHGLAVYLATGASSNADLQWSYWNGAWTSLETAPFSDGTFNLQYQGYVYWSDYPAGWATTTVSDATPLYYVRACLNAAPPVTRPVEAQIGRADISIASTANLTGDMTGIINSPRGGFVAGQNNVSLANVAFVNTGVGTENLHLAAGSFALNVARTLDSYFDTDIDATVRPAGAWDVGADEYNGTTEVRLMSFTAAPGDGSVALEWRTASELDNLGFHVYRGLSEAGPWTRVTPSLVPGLGSSATGQAYSFQDTGLVNGTRYYYRLEDVDAASRTTSHGPVTAVPQAGGTSGGESGRTVKGKRVAAGAACPDWVLSAYASDTGADGGTAALVCARHGDPEAVSLDEVSRDSRSATLELRTGGFYSLRDAAGTVRVFVPGFEFPSDPQTAALPFRRAMVDALVGRRVELAGARALEQVAFPGLVPGTLGKAEMQVSWDGTVRAGRRGVRAPAAGHATTDLVRLLPSVFQGETKRAVVEISPLRFDARRQQLLLAKRVRLRLLFAGREAAESGRGRLGRRPPPSQPASGELLARLYTASRGLHAVSFDQLFPGRRRGLDASQLRLERQGVAQAFHLEPASGSFGPGGVLYFQADAEAASTDFASETAFELVLSRDGVTMPLVSAAPSGGVVGSAPIGSARFETNRFYQPGLLDAPDPWLWDSLASGTTRVESFALSAVSSSAPRAAEVEVFLQGASESGAAVDHHVSVSLNGAAAGEARFAGKQPYRMRFEVPASLLREGANELELTNVADTGVTSYVFLDRFTVSYPQTSSLTRGVFEGTWSESGWATVSDGATALLDVTAAPAWLYGYETSGGVLRFRVQAGHRYLAVAPQGLLTPRVAAPAASTLRATTNQADYLLIAPRAFLAAAEPLLEQRRDQGLAARGVAFEEIADAFGHGQPSAEAIHAFLAYAYQSWARPSPRYVLLLGDSSFDPRNFTGSAAPAPLPALWTKTSYLWTVSDPLLAAVNGDDELPDLAIGRLPAATVAEAERLVAKLLAWEDSGQGLGGQAALVADNPDLGGDFEADVHDIARSFLAERQPRLLLLSQLGAGTRPAIQQALDSGLGLLSYVGHGGSAVWASENVWNSWDAARLQAQSRQPLLLTFNCLNGYFVAPSFESLSESLLKADGRGAIASFTPSGLSLDGPAHQYHRALMAELTSGRHARLGDAIAAAQASYAQTGLLPELVRVYHLLGDPATPIR